MLIIGGTGYLYGGMIGALVVQVRAGLPRRREPAITGSSGSACCLS